MKGTIDKLREWASDGGTQIETPADAKIDHGWNVDEQPPNVWENWKNNRDEQKINELIDLHDLNCENDINAEIGDRCSGLIDDNQSLVNPVNTINRTNPAVVSICRGYDYANSRECVFGLRASGTGAQQIVNIFNNEEDTTIDYNWVTTNIPTGLTPVDLCCDGYYIFLMFNSGSDLELYRVPIGSEYTNGIATTYDAHLELAGKAVTTKYKGLNGRGGKRMCVANGTNIAFLNIIDDCITIVTKALDAHTDGIGTFDAVTDPYTPNSPCILERGICSDGDRVWFVGSFGKSGELYNCEILGAALISDPTDDTAGLTRDWATDPPYWAFLLSDDPNFIYMSVNGLAYDGQNINIGVSGRYLSTHGTWVLQFDVPSEMFFNARFHILDGRVKEDSTSYNGGITFTGRRIAVVSPVCPGYPFDEIIGSANETQLGLALLDPFKGGIDLEPYTYWDTQGINIDADQVTALESTAAVADASRIADIVFSDNCIWVLVYRFTIGSDTVSSQYIIRVTSISER